VVDTAVHHRASECRGNFAEERVGGLQGKGRVCM